VHGKKTECLITVRLSTESLITALSGRPIAAILVPLATRGPLWW